MNQLDLFSFDDDKNLKLRPPLKWAGGKRWLVPYLKTIWRRYAQCRLVEPFCGGLAVTLGLLPDTALLSDVNRHLINFYIWLQAGLHLTINARNDQEIYYQHREAFNELIRSNLWNTRQSAELFYYLNRTGYNGLCRFNKSGEFNVPFGKYKTINYTYDFTDYCFVMSSWIFECKDFEQVSLKLNDFIYADPPYDVEFVQYSEHGFSWQDQVRLITWLSKTNLPFVISNQATERIIELYKDYHLGMLFVDAPRMISSDGDRTPAREVIATNIQDAFGK
jgi:DNA adenine methylase